MNSVSLFGERLKEERERLSLSQVAAGAAAGVSREMWGKYERGAMPGGEVMLSLVGAGFDMAYLFTGIRDVPSAPVLRVEQVRAGCSVEVLSKEEQALLDNYRHCSGEVQQGIKAQAVAMSKSKGKVKKAG